MKRCAVEQIFEAQKHLFFDNVERSHDKPLAIILGGQSACGKGLLLNVAKEDHFGENFLVINGDLYRHFHPDSFKYNAQAYSKETQIFSIVFTERLIEEAIRMGFSVIVEGTMRNLDVSLKTACQFREAGYSVEAYAIASPRAITQLGIYSRFQEELEEKGFGRLAEINVHDEAYRKLPNTIDALYERKAVDKISLHTYLAKDRIKDYVLENNLWNCKISPSHFIEKAINSQVQDRELILSCIEYGERLVNNVRDYSIKKEMQNSIEQLKFIVSTTA